MIAFKAAMFKKHPKAIGIVSVRKHNQGKYDILKQIFPRL